MSIKYLAITTILALVFAYCANLLWIKASYISTLQRYTISPSSPIEKMGPKPIIWSPFTEDNCSYYTSLILETQNYLNKKGWQDKFTIIKNSSDSHNSNFQNEGAKFRKFENLRQLMGL